MIHAAYFDRQPLQAVVDVLDLNTCVLWWVGGSNTCLTRRHVLQIVRKLHSEPSFFGQNQADTQVEGMAQLRACIWRFDQGKGVCFSTYLWTQLYTRIRQALVGKDSTLHVPRREMELRKRYGASLTHVCWLCTCVAIQHDNSGW